MKWLKIVPRDELGSRDVCYDIRLLSPIWTGHLTHGLWVRRRSDTSRTVIRLKILLSPEFVPLFPIACR
jgi:hypothetical protein